MSCSHHGSSPAPGSSCSSAPAFSPGLPRAWPVIASVRNKHAWDDRRERGSAQLRGGPEYRSSPVGDEPGHSRTEGDRPLVLDELAERLERYASLRDTDSAAADAVLDELGATGDIDRDIVVELAGTAPLAYPERFAEA